jgi:hypothetical protein
VGTTTKTILRARTSTGEWRRQQALAVSQDTETTGNICKLFRCYRSSSSALTKDYAKHITRYIAPLLMFEDLEPAKHLMETSDRQYLWTDLADMVHSFPTII